MAGQIRKPNNREFDIRDDETYSDWKRRKAEEEGKGSCMGQKNKKDTSNWSDAQKRGRRSRNKGMRKQNEARKQLRDQTPGLDQIWVTRKIGVVN